MIIAKYDSWLERYANNFTLKAVQPSYAASSELTIEISFCRKRQKLRLFVVPPLKFTNSKLGL